MAIHWAHTLILAFLAGVNFVESYRYCRSGSYGTATICEDSTFCCGGSCCYYWWPITSSIGGLVIIGVIIACCCCRRSQQPGQILGSTQGPTVATVTTHQYGGNIPCQNLVIQPGAQAAGYQPQQAGFQPQQAGLQPQQAGYQPQPQKAYAPPPAYDQFTSRDPTPRQQKYQEKNSFY